MKTALAPGAAHHGPTAGRSDGPRNRVPPNVPPPVLHVPSPVLAVLSKVTPGLSPACGPCAHALVYMEAPVICRDSAEFCRAVDPRERAGGKRHAPARGDTSPPIPVAAREGPARYRGAWQVAGKREPVAARFDGTQSDSGTATCPGTLQAGRGGSPQPARGWLPLSLTAA